MSRIFFFRRLTKMHFNSLFSSCTEKRKALGWQTRKTTTKFVFTKRNSQKAERERGRERGPNVA